MTKQEAIIVMHSMLSERALFIYAREKEAIRTVLSGLSDLEDIMIAIRAINKDAFGRAHDDAIDRLLECANLPSKPNAFPLAGRMGAHQGASEETGSVGTAGNVYSRCTYKLQEHGVPYPRTCEECGLGPCKVRGKTYGNTWRCQRCGKVIAGENDNRLCYCIRCERDLAQAKEGGAS